LLVALALAAIGLLTLASASVEMPVDYLPRQGLWIGLGLCVFFFFLLVDYHLLLALAMPIYCLALLFLVAVFFFGHQAGGARSWVGLAGLGLQPSELMKLACALLLARYVAAIKSTPLELRHLLPAITLIALPIGLVMLEPDLGGALMFVPMFACCALVAGIRGRLLAVSAIVALLLGAGAWRFAMRDYQRQRVITFLTPESDPLGAGYQVRQSRIAVGSGQLLGRGFKQGTQSQLRFLPARHTDFIFAVLAEERGFLGVITVLGLYALYLYNGVQVAIRARDHSGTFLVVALLSTLTFHALYNTAMMIGFVPVTGIPLPFLSYGGSFTLFCFATTGVILGVDYRRFVNA
jgi:rod shape determining protein RodA